MNDVGIITVLLFATNGLVTYAGLQNRELFRRYSFWVEPILGSKQYERILSSGFLHVNWMHFAFNMITLYFFSPGLEALVGIPSFLLIYLGSLVGGNLLALMLHRHHPNYRAVGASGAVSGLVFAAIALMPGIKIGLFLIPFFIPGWLFGLIYVFYSIYGIRSQRDNIGHEAHLGGGIIGLLISILLYPSLIFTNTLPIVAILVPSLIFLVLVIYRPSFSTPKPKLVHREVVEMDYQDQKVNKERELNRILDKINHQGMDSLTPQEKETLERLGS